MFGTFQCWSFWFRACSSAQKSLFFISSILCDLKFSWLISTTNENISDIWLSWFNAISVQHRTYHSGQHVSIFFVSMQCEILYGGYRRHCTKSCEDWTGTIGRWPLRSVEIAGLALIFWAHKQVWCIFTFMFGIWNVPSHQSRKKKCQAFHV